MSFLLILIAALHNNRITFGMMLGAYLALTTWCLTQSVLLRESDRHRSGTGVTVTLRRAIGGSILSSALIFSVALGLFLLIPRHGQTAWTQYRFRSGQTLSGFDERINLGQLGTILESDEEVMVVHLFDETGQPFSPREEPYWRGIALTHYRDGQWERMIDPRMTLIAPPANRPPRYIRQEIRMQAVHQDVLFGLRPIFAASTRAGEPLAILNWDGGLVRPETVPLGPLQYTVESHVGSSEPQPYEYSPQSFIESNRRRADLTHVPDELRDQLRAYVAGLNLPATDAVSLCRFLLDHLQSDEFDYTLRGGVVNAEIDPVLDFLLNRKEGHCEYFASALALMLRAHNVPTRVINGFKGGDANELLGKSIVVRQKHAHSWVEALVRRPGQSDFEWLTLDPTPGQSRQRVVAMVNPSSSALRQLRDTSRQLWSSYVLNFNSTEQENAIYGPVRVLVATQIQNAVETARAVWTSRPQRFNWVAALLGSGSMAAIILLLRMLVRLAAAPEFTWMENGQSKSRGFLARLIRSIRKWLAPWTPGESTLQRRVAFYDQLLRVLQAHGLSKPASATPQQFAEHAGLELARSPRAATVARVPAELVDRYYRVRFGHENLSAPETDAVGRLLEQLSDALATDRKTKKE
jgi:transglutaminase-like putative cysteine protease